MFLVNLLLDVFSSDIFFYGSLFIIIARGFRLITLDKETNQVFDLLIDFAAFVSVIHMMVRLSEAMIKLFQS